MQSCIGIFFLLLKHLSLVMHYTCHFLLSPFLSLNLSTQLTSPVQVTFAPRSTATYYFAQVCTGNKRTRGDERTIIASTIFGAPDTFIFSAQVCICTHFFTSEFGHFLHLRWARTLTHFQHHRHPRRSFAVDL